MPLTDSPAVKKSIADAQAAGNDIAQDAFDFAQTVIAHVSGAVPMIVVDLSDAALAAFYDAVPGGIRGEVQAIVGAVAAGTEKKLTAAATQEIQNALGLVLNRLSTWVVKIDPHIHTDPTT